MNDNRKKIIIFLLTISICGMVFCLMNDKGNREWMKKQINSGILFATHQVYENNYPMYSYAFQEKKNIPFYIDMINASIPITNYMTKMEQESYKAKVDKEQEKVVNDVEKLQSNQLQSNKDENMSEASTLGESNSDTSIQEETTSDTNITQESSVNNLISENKTTEESKSLVEESKENEQLKEVALIPVGTSIVSNIQQLDGLGGVHLEQLKDFEYLKKNLYVVDGKTSVTKNQLNPSVLLSKDLTIKGDNTKPQILIYHTHSQEAYKDSVSGNLEDTIIGVGNYLTSILTEQYGYHVIHHTGVYDMTDGKIDRNPAYEKALPNIEQILKDNPSIEIVIDLHRDGVDENVHLVTEVNGKQTAKLMFFNGMCRDANGEIAGMENPYREDNLAFSLQMALTTKAYYPDLLRVIYLNKNRYNQHIASRCALVEVGAQTNTVEEAMNAMPLLADILHKVIGKS